MSTSHTRMTVLSLSLAVVLCLANAAPVQAGESDWLSDRGRATAYANNFLQEFEISNGSADMFNFGWGGIDVNVDLGDFDATGISLHMLIDTINAEWLSSVSPAQAPARPYFDDGPNQWKLRLTNPDGDLPDVFTVADTNAVGPLDALADFSAFPPADQTTQIWTSSVGTATTYASNYITAAEITDGSMDLISFGFGARAIDVDLGAYQAMGISLHLLVDEVNAAWQANIDGSQQVASAYFDDTLSQWRLRLIDPDGDGTDFAVADFNAIAAFDTIAEWQSILRIPEPMTLSLLALGGAAVLTKRKK